VVTCAFPTYAEIIEQWTSWNAVKQR